MQLGPSDTLPSLSLEIFKLWLDEALGSWSNAKSEPALEGKLGLGTPEIQAAQAIL